MKPALQGVIDEEASERFLVERLRFATHFRFEQADGLTDGKTALRDLIHFPHEFEGDDFAYVYHVVDRGMGSEIKAKLLAPEL